MSDLSELHAAGTTKIAGSDSTAEETYFLDVTSNGSAKTELQVGSQQIGNVGDRLKVNADVTISGGIDITNKIRYEDMNASTGGVARDTLISTTWTNVYSYTGVGKLIGFNLNLDSPTTLWAIRLVLDSTIDVFFGTTGIITLDMFSQNLYDMAPGGSYPGGNLGFSLTDHDNIIWNPPVSSGIIPFYSKLEIKVKRLDAATKKFKAGFVCLIKDS